MRSEKGWQIFSLFFRGEKSSYVVHGKFLHLRCFFLRGKKDEKSTTVYKDLQNEEVPLKLPHFAPCRHPFFTDAALRSVSLGRVIEVKNYWPSTKSTLHSFLVKHLYFYFSHLELSDTFHVPISIISESIIEFY